METHAAQDIKMVLMHAGQYPLADGGECAFVVGQKDCLNERGYMNPTPTNTGGWDACERREWCNGNYKNAYPPILLPIFRQMKVVTANGAGATTVDSIDTFALPAEKEVFGKKSYADSTAEVNLFRFDFYKINSNKVKKIGTSNGEYYERSPRAADIGDFCIVTNAGTAYVSGDLAATELNGLAPLGCIGKKVTA